MNRLEDNGKLFETNFGELGLKVKFLKANNTPLGELYLYNMVYMSEYNKKYIKSLLEKIALYHHLGIRLVDNKEAHFGLLVSTAESPLSLAQCMLENGQRDIVIGKNASGELIKLDFEKIPHLLIAGTTGSGKSVLLHNILVNLMSFYRTNNEGNRFRRGVATLIIDPKGNELSMYKNVKDTIFVDNTKQAINALNWVASEMDRRYRENTPQTSDLFVIIDELADLMLTSKFQVEESIVRIAQKGRACGIHLIVATQRPTVDVCSGLIKANMPYRIALRTASVRDSVVILDRKGAEALNVGEGILKEGLKEQHFKIAMAENELESKFIDTNRG